LEELAASRGQLQSQVFRLMQDIETAQSEVIFKLAEVVEARSLETGQHVVRVAEISYRLALKSGMDEEQAEVLRLAAAMHDVGKVGIPDVILHNPGKLSADEFAIMKTHTTTGYEMLKGSNGGVLQAAAVIALQHHEKYNGKGYPLGLSGDRINIFGRITCVADVFDALSSDRVYRRAWDLEDIIQHMRKERGRCFDPMLVDLLLDNLDDFLAVRKALPAAGTEPPTRLLNINACGSRGSEGSGQKTGKSNSKTGGQTGISSRGLLEPPKVLLCQDDPATRELLITTLGERGYEPVLADSGEKVWQMLKASPTPRLAVLDTAMSDRDCISLCRRLRSRKGQDYTYVLLLTGGADRREIIEATEAGADCCLPKPVDPAELRVRLLAAQRILDLQTELITARETLREQATRDGLTGLWNRPAIMDILSMELNRAGRQQTSVGVILADLDYFKRINDTYGHRAGDVVLCESAHCMRAAFRPYDGFGRYGGEEFLVVLPRCGITFAGYVADRLRKCVEKQIVTVGETQFSITVSMGVAAKCGESDTDAGELIHAADEALYRAKAAGRNCVRIAGQQENENE